MIKKPKDLLRLEREHRRKANKRRNKEEWKQALGIKSPKQLNAEKNDRLREQKKQNWKQRRNFGSRVKYLSVTEYLERRAKEGNTTRDFQPEAPQRKKSYRVTSIYALCDPDTMVARYIGKSNYPERRYEQHIQDLTGPKGKWIANLLANGKLPVLKIIEECDYEVWQSRERHWISHFRSTQRIFNRSAGGDQSNQYDNGRPRLDTPTSSEPSS